MIKSVLKLVVLCLRFLHRHILKMIFMFALPPPPLTHTSQHVATCCTAPFHPYQRAGPRTRQRRTRHVVPASVHWLAPGCRRVRMCPYFHPQFADVDNCDPAHLPTRVRQRGGHFRRHRCTLRRTIFGIVGCVLCQGGQGQRWTHYRAW
jgi:hypothetical protein